MQSGQETLVRKLADRSMGAQFVFEPAEYRKGNASREPADLVWASNSTVLLMSMKSGNKSITSKERSAQKQLLGGLRAWRDLDIPLREIRNGETTREVRYEAGTEVVLAAVVSDADAPVRLDAALASKAGVSLACSVPHRLVETVADNYGSSRDLIETLLELQVDVPTSIAAVEDALLRRKLSAWVASGLGALPEYSASATADYLAANLLALRQIGGITAATSGAQCADPAAALDDLGWPGLYALVAAIYNPNADRRPEIWRPEPSPSEFQMASMSLWAALRASGAGQVFVTTIAAPPEGEPWPPAFVDSVTTVQIERHTFVAARVRDIGSPRVHRAWDREWRGASRRCTPGFPPVGIISWQSEMGHGFVLAGQEGVRDSETRSRLAQHSP